eukprot:10638459-Alexandrium_andersonii.AAC.1
MGRAGSNFHAAAAEKPRPNDSALVVRTAPGSNTQPTHRQHASSRQRAQCPACGRASIPAKIAWRDGNRNRPVAFGST